MKKPMKDLALKEVLELIACDKPAPGGGTAAALACGMAASLACMVASITMGKERYREWRGEMEMIATSARRLMSQSLDMAEQDSRSYQAVIAAMRMPKGSAEESFERQKALRLAYKKATEVPLAICRASVDILEQCLCLARHGLGSASTDVAIASMAAGSAFEGALALVGVNLPEAADETYRGSVKKEIEELSAAKARLASEVASVVEERQRG